MNDESQIAKFTGGLSRTLGRIPAGDRDDIVNEIRGHLEFRAGEGKLKEALTALGTPQECARGFLEELRLQEAYADGGPSKTFGALLALASQRTTAALGLFISGIFFALALGFALTGVAEVVAPEFAGLWTSDRGDFFFGIVDKADTQIMDEKLGRWLLPVAAGLSVIAFVLAQWLGRFFLKLMMGKRRAAI